jgi:hypothetical protein
MSGNCWQRSLIRSWASKEAKLRSERLATEALQGYSCNQNYSYRQHDSKVVDLGSNESPQHYILLRLPMKLHSRAL